MDRQEFSALLKSKRIESGFSMNKVAMTLMFEWNRIQRIERGETNFIMGNVFRYLDTFGYCIQLAGRSHRKSFILHNLDDFRQFFIEIRQLMELSKRQASIKLNIPQSRINRIECTNADLSVDIFLKCIYGLGYEVKVIKDKRKIKNNENE